MRPANGRIAGLLAVAAALAVACGYLAEKGEEPKGDKNQPSSGVGVYEKQDFNCSADLAQPFMIVADPQTTLAEPWVIYEDGQWKMWFEQRKAGTAGIVWYTTFSIVRAPLTEDCRDYDVPTNPAVPVFEAPAGGWENASPSSEGGVGAPTILDENGVYRMWYAGGNWTGIGYAESTDGLHWTRADASGNSDSVDPRAVRPLLVADQAWEKGSIGSPSVVFQDGLYRMWYDGNVMEARAIGYADSPDGIHWTKRDPLGRSSDERPGEVAPVLVADQTNWEFDYPTDPYGRVGTPNVIVHRSPLRTYYLLYYTGNLSGRLSYKMTAMDASIGIAWSSDGVNWTKAPSYSIPEKVALEINPIVSEKLPISIGPQVPDSSNSHSALTNVNETTPMVVEVPEELAFYMYFQQIDGINNLKGLQGIAFAYTRNASN